ncbi:putative actin binding protein [Paratrimastix pyriformis]|uniref:Actin binding protein n=1 Tax=Paratrimastix pyriformis TaxID=342808 RepID=A0ABQ8UHQ0_9EUKA|nr:putative actin binding protein [Paratrimastix pyriformis]|eukprot:GAFH01001188.1.p1 GENE.GAFH01001188.1~~GAFH01001188.1.p1  ORF type:complete len:533 (-),score=152.76 GAFH01001188.1:216-1814(-)
MATSTTGHPHLTVVQGTVSGVHAYSQEEKTAFVEYLNLRLAGDPDLASLLPIPSDGEELFRVVGNGILLCKLVNNTKPGTIEERFINKKPRLSVFEIHENLNLALNSAKAIGCSLINIGAVDMIEGRPHLVLALIWQLMRLGMTSKINLVDHPELFRLLEEGESLDTFRKQPPEAILMRWFNYHLRKANHPATHAVTNFSSDVKDSINYTVLLHQIAPQHCDLSGLDEPNLEARATKVLDDSLKLGCHRIIMPRDICSGNSKLNTTLVAELFNAWPALEPPEDLSKLQVVIDDENSAESREERAFRNWINNLGIEGNINNLFTDLQDGLILLQVIDRLRPGKINWSRVNRTPKLIFKKHENTNYAVQMAQELGCRVVGFDGRNITEGNKLYTLALTWQLMRFHVLNFLKEMSASSGGGREITEQVLVEMMNNKLSAAGKQTRIRDLHDPSLQTAFPLLDLVAAVEPRAIDESLIRRSDPLTAEDKTFNAKYAIAAARKIGCAIFCVHEDITQGKDKLIMTFIAQCLSVQNHH